MLTGETVVFLAKIRSSSEMVIFSSLKKHEKISEISILCVNVIINKLVTASKLEGFFSMKF